MINSISKTDQLKEIILREIRQGTYKHGDALPSIQEFCRQYGVSKHTVSQALSNLSELGFIDTAAGKLTRVSDKLSRRLVEIAYVGYGELEQQEFWSEIYRGIMAEFENHSNVECRVRPLLNDRYNPVKNTDLVHTSGYLLMGVISPDWLEYLQKNRIPTIMVYDRLVLPEVSFVSVDYRDAMDRLVKMFIDRGRKKIAYINRFPAEDFPNVNREKFLLFKDALHKYGLAADESQFKHCCGSLGGSYRATMELLQGDNRPDGIFLSSDVIAPGVYRALHESGLTIPGDVAVAGCDNLEIADFMVPSLTSIELERRTIGRKAAAALVKLLDRTDISDLPVIREYVKPEIIVRESLQ